VLPPSAVEDPNAFGAVKHVHRPEVDTHSVQLVQRQTDGGAVRKQCRNCPVGAVLNPVDVDVWSVTHDVLGRQETTVTSKENLSAETSGRIVVGGADAGGEEPMWT
jgi:hypothetical protein